MFGEIKLFPEYQFGFSYTIFKFSGNNIITLSSIYNTYSYFYFMISRKNLIILWVIYTHSIVWSVLLLMKY